MKKSIIILALITTILILTLAFFVNNVITGRAVDPIIKNFSYTKAICDSSNFCQDYEIKCQGKETISVTPITGAAVQFPPNWKDLRNKEEIDRLCD